MSDRFMPFEEPVVINGIELRNGDTVMYTEHGQTYTGTAVYDEEWNGWFRVGGRSINSIICDCDNVKIV